MWWKVLLVILLLAIIGLINYEVVISLQWWGYFQTTYNHGPHGLQCRKLSGTERGSYDIQLISGTGLSRLDGVAFISSGVKHYADNVTEGKILLFDMNDKAGEPEELEIGAADSDFKLVRPGGMGYWPEGGSIILYVIDHRPDEGVNKFKYNPTEPKKLTHEGRIANESAFESLADLVVVGKDKFYFTNYKKYHYDIRINMVLGLHHGSVGYYNGSHAELVKEDLFQPSGIALSSDTRFLYVGLVGGREIRIYSILSNNKLSYNNSIEVSTTVWNLFVSSSNDIWFGASPVIYKTMNYLKNPDRTAASQIMHVNMSTTWQAEKIEEVYSNNGTEISGLNTVVKSGDDLLIGTMVSDAYFCV